MYENDATYERFRPIDEENPEINTEKQPLLHTDSNDSIIANTSASPTQANVEEDGEHRYEDFSSKLTLQCPTCKGKGKLTQGQADSMVALIPVRDKRLKPRKTKLYLGVTFVICMIVTFLVTFFLLPRSVTMEIIDLQSLNIYMPDDLKSIPFIDLAITYKIKNENFFEADISNIKQDISWNHFLLNTSVTSGNGKFHVNGRTVMNHTVVVRQIFQGDVTRKVKRICAYGWKWSLLEMFVNTATVSYLYRNEQISNTFYGYTCCHNSTILERKKRSVTLTKDLC